MNQFSKGRGGIVNAIAVFLISVYQKVISPVKGFSCAHRHLHGGLSCSEYVKQVVIRKGIASGYADIQSRFVACRSAADKIQRQYPRAEAGFLDCGLDGCGDFGSCFDGGGADGSSGKSSTIVIFPSLLLIIILIFIFFVWFDGPQVNNIDIRLIEGQQEAQETGVARLIGGEKLDYQIVFTVNGKKIPTNTIDNSSAKNWLSLQPGSGFALEDLDQITILNKQVLEDKVLEIIDDPGREGSGELYEYRISED